ncbi:MAG: 2-oxo acid dehydrogenase subunit E2 [Oscillospiraceae bacterium]|nr:2-oxo acid dehydrogenase subunit E2 [Oscillospiraceae bacterium]
MPREGKRRWGDRRDARYVRDVPALNTIMFHLMPNRTDSEVYLHDEIDCTELVKFLEEKNAAHPNYKTTIFHCFAFAVARMIRERPKMNRYIKGRRVYERNEISLSFIAKRRFRDDAEESLMVVVPKDEDTIDSFSHLIYGDLQEMRKSEHADGGIDSIIEAFAKIPRVLLMGVFKIIRWLDFWHIMPKALTDGDTNYTTVLLSNLGSIGGPAVYHHLNNYGTNSIMVTIGTLHKAEMLMPDGTKEIRDVLDIGATLDERIADGFYFVRSMKLLKYIFANPQLLDQPFSQDSGFQFE